MSTTELTMQTFEQVLTDNAIVLIDWWASWCGPCRQFAPIYEQASDQHPDIVFGKIDTEAEMQLATMAEITSIPTLMAFRDGMLVFREAGALPAPTLQNLIEQIKALDMDEVRRQIVQAHSDSANDDSAQGESNQGDSAQGESNQGESPRPGLE